MTDRSHLSIGEVLSLLRDEFPDVTISKIRFLESQGLVDPERTPSGYRKFYDHDVERLRWILRQQRENFLPLKVIKGRLSDGEDTSEVDPGAGDPAADGADGPSEDVAVPAGHSLDNGDGGAASPEIVRTAVPLPAGPFPAEAFARLPASAGGGGSGGSAAVSRRSTPGASTPASPPPPAPPAPAPPPPAPPAAAPAPAGPAATRPAPPAPGAAAAAVSEEEADQTYTLDELISRSGLELEQVEELTRFGLIAPQSSSGGERYYDRDAVAIATVSAGFARHGVEARHLRGWRTSAEREVSLFEQVVVPLLRQRNPQARTQAAATLDELGHLGATLREILVRRALDDVH